jgi:hypothetical protein
VTEDRRKIIGAKISDLYRDLSNAVNAATESLDVKDQLHPDRRPGFDWQIMKQNIDKVLTQYFGRIAEIDSAKFFR